MLYIYIYICETDFFIHGINYSFICMPIMNSFIYFRSCDGHFTEEIRLSSCRSCWGTDLILGSSGQRFYPISPSVVRNLWSSWRYKVTQSVAIRFSMNEYTSKGEHSELKVFASLLT